MFIFGDIVVLATTDWRKPIDIFAAVFAGVSLVILIMAFGFHK